MKMGNKKEYEPDVLKLYFKDMNKIPLLSREEELILSKRIQNGDRSALDKLIESNLRFVVVVAKKYRGNGLSFMDLISEGNIGLIKAAQKYDATRGYRFITYAVWWIRQSIIRSIYNQSKSIRLPSNKMLKLLKIEKTYYSLSEEFDHIPTIDDIAKRSKMSSSDIDKLLKIPKEPISLDKLLNDSYSALIDNLSDSRENVFRYVENRMLKDYIDNILEFLTDAESDIIRSRFGLNGRRMTLSELSIKYKITKERIRQIEEKALDKLRSMKESRNLLIDYLEG